MRQLDTLTESDDEKVVVSPATIPPSYKKNASIRSTGTYKSTVPLPWMVKAAHHLEHIHLLVLKTRAAPLTLPENQGYSAEATPLTHRSFPTYFWLSLCLLTLAQAFKLQEHSDDVSVVYNSVFSG